MSINTGGANGSDPVNAELYAYEAEGRGNGSLAQLRTDGTEVVELGLRDHQSLDRLLPQVDADGVPSLQLLDADGTVIWSAPGPPHPVRHESRGRVTRALSTPSEAKRWEVGAISWV